MNPGVTELAPELQLAALTNLGQMYAQGLGVEQDFARALDCYRQAAEHGVPQAQSNLAVMYAHGQGVQQDFAQAHKWYRAAAEERGVPLTDPEAREIVYGMPYDEWKKQYQK